MTKKKNKRAKLVTHSESEVHLRKAKSYTVRLGGEAGNEECSSDHTNKTAAIAAARRCAGQTGLRHFVIATYETEAVVAEIE